MAGASLRRVDFCPDAGFTLIEIMLSVLILGIGLTVVANSYVGALRGINAAQNNIQALTLGKEKFDALEISSLKEGLDISFAEGILEPTNKKYGYSLNIGKLTQSGDLAKSLVQACLRINWQEQSAVKYVTFSAYLPKKKE
ncbi:MAG: prepilin-type N-terminal cleavage/methylation domain-containing protein [Candidatus Omnitrophota bacterium]